MTAGDFTAAQQRVAARYQARLVDGRSLSSRRDQQIASIRSRIPIPGIESGLTVWNQLKDSQGIPPAYRVGQLDAELLDEELLELLRGQIGDGLKFFGVSTFSIYSTI